MEDIIDLEMFSGGGGPPFGPSAELESCILGFYEHLQYGRVPEAETVLLSMVAAWPDHVPFANMLPGLLATAVPKILGHGSGYFTFADGEPLIFGGAHSPPEYTMVYLELLLHKNLLGHPPVPLGSPVHRTISVMWDILLDIIPASRKAEAITRFDSYTPLPDNVVRFRRKH